MSRFYAISCVSPTLQFSLKVRYSHNPRTLRIHETDSEVFVLLEILMKSSCNEQIRAPPLSRSWGTIRHYDTGYHRL